MSPVSILDPRTPLEMEKDNVSSPRVIRQRKASHGSESETPKTPPRSAKHDDRHFFGANFSLENVGDLAKLQKSSLRKKTSHSLTC